MFVFTKCICTFHTYPTAPQVVGVINSNLYLYSQLHKLLCPNTLFALQGNNNNTLRINDKNATSTKINRAN